MNWKLFLTVAVVCATAGLVRAADETAPAAEAQPAAPAENANGLNTLEQKVAYGIGLNLGSQLKRDGVNIDIKVLADGINDAVSGAEPKLAAQEIQMAFMQLQQQLQAKAAEKQTAQAKVNLEKGNAFLAENAKAEGVKTTESGLQYKVIKQGDGPTPKATDNVTTHYRGTLIDGTVFDSSIDRGQPATFPVNRVIPGWTEALQMMPVGSKWKLFVPASLAYGEQGAGEAIGPNETLIFDVELIKIEPADQPEAPATPQLEQQ